MTNTSAVPTVRHRGPSLLLLAIVHIALVIAGLVSAAVLSHGARMALPYESVQAAVAYFEQNALGIQVAAFFQFGSAIPLGIFAATVVSLLRFHGVRAAGTWIALFGGLVAPAFLMLSALCGWVLASPGFTEYPGSVRALQLLGFAAGGPGYIVPLGLLIAGVSITSYFTRLVPRWLAWFGIVLAVASELSSLTLLTWKAALFLPIGRFVTFIWLIGVAITLPAVSRSKRANAS